MRSASYSHAVHLLTRLSLVVLSCVTLALPAVLGAQGAQAETCVSRGTSGARCSNGSNSGSSTYIRGRDWQLNSGTNTGTNPGGSGGYLPAGRKPAQPSWIRHLCPDGKVYSAVACPEPASPVEEPVFHVVTVDDLAAFQPLAPVAHSEPRNWSIRGRYSNFYVESSQHVVSGELFGDSVEVLFTPESFDWDYGDGATAQFEQAGSPWSVLKLGTFSSTSTSHKFVSTGTMTVTVTAQFSAQYRLAGGDWLPVEGYVSQSSNPLRILVLAGKNILASRACSVASKQRGC